MQVITSKDNDIIKAIKKLKEKKYREETNQYMVEGIKMIEEAIEEGAKITRIVICEDCITENSIEQKLLYEIAKYECIYVSKKVFESISDVITPQGILATIEKKNNEEEINYEEDMIVVLDGIQDPGNLGTIIRTIDSANLKQVIVSSQTADAYNPKVIRSTMGAIFRVNVIESPNLIETMKKLKKHQFKVVASSLNAQQSIYDMNYMKKAIVIGNEGNGISPEIQEIADSKVKIPMLGKTESLNASVATGIMIYEYVRNKVQIKK